MHHPIAHILRIPQGGDHGEHPLLLRPFQVGLEAHDVVNGPLGVVLAQLHHGRGLPSGLGVLQSHRLQRSVAQGIPPPAGHHLHRHTALKDPGVLKAMDLRLLGGGQSLPEALVLLLRHGAVDVVRRPPVIPGGKPGALHVHAVKGDQRGRRVKEVQIAVLRIAPGDGLRQWVGGQRPAGHDDLSLRRKVCDLPLHHSDLGVAPDLLRNGFGEGMAVHCQRAARLHPVGVRAGHDEGAAAAQFLLQQPHRVLQLVGAQGVGAHQLAEGRAVVGRGHLLGFHLPKRHGDPPPGQLPGGLAARQARSDHNYRFHGSLLILIFLVCFAARHRSSVRPTR